MNDQLSAYFVFFLFHRWVWCMVSYLYHFILLTIINRITKEHQLETISSSWSRSSQLQLLFFLLFVFAIVICQYSIDSFVGWSKVPINSERKWSDWNWWWETSVLFHSSSFFFSIGRILRISISFKLSQRNDFNRESFLSFVIFFSFHA